MKGLKSIGGLRALALVASAAVLWLVLRTPEPSYQGKSLSTWFDQLYHAERGVGPAENAIRNIGPVAVPVLLEKVRDDHQRARQFYREAWRKMPRWAQRVAPRPRWRDESLPLRVKWALRLIGPSGLPQYLQALEDKDIRIRSLALEVIGASGSEAAAAAPAVCRIVAEDNLDLVAKALSVLGQLGAGDPAVVSVLTSRLHCQPQTNRQPDTARPGPFRMTPAVQASCVREQAARALGRLGSKGSAAAPELRALLHDAYPAPRTEAAIALWRVARDTNGLPVLLAELERRPHPLDCQRLLRGLAEMGPTARAGAPVVVRFLAEKSAALAAGTNDVAEASSAGVRVTRDFDAILARDAQTTLARIDPFEAALE